MNRRVCEHGSLSCSLCHPCGGLIPRHDSNEQTNHPAYYGGADNPYEAIKVIEAWGLGFSLGNVLKYISRAGKKGTNPLMDTALDDLLKARWYLNREIERLEKAKT